MSEVVVVDMVTERSSRISLPKLQLYHAALVTVKKSMYVAVASNQGLQIWSADGNSMLFFCALSEITPSSVDQEGQFMRGISYTPTHIAVGTSFGVVAVFDTTGPEILLLDRIRIDEIVSNAPRKSNAQATAHAITVLASSSRMFFGGNDDGEVFAFSLDETSTNGSVRLEPVCKFPPAVLGTPVTAICADEHSSTDIVYAGFADGHIRIYRTQIQEMSVEICAHVRAVTGLSTVPSIGCLVSCAEDQFFQAWRLPDFVNGKAFPSAASDFVASEGYLVFSERIDNRLCTGLAVLRGCEGVGGVGGVRVAVASYDDDCLVVFQGR